MRRVLFLTFLLILIPGQVFSIDIELEGNVRRSFGSSKYTIKFNIAEDVKGTSELEFPMDGYLCGVRLSLGTDLPRNHDIRFYLDGTMSMTDPKNPMTDIDRVRLAFKDIQLTWSSTESEAKAKGYDIDVGVAAALISKVTDEYAAWFRLGFGYRYRKVSHEIYGVDGWQLDENLERVYFNVLADTCVLEYEVELRAPYFFFDFQATNRNRLAFIGQAGYAPNAIVEDYDDHILRMKRMTGNCKGYAILGEASIRYFFEEQNDRPRMFVSVKADVLYSSANGYQKQVWYGDEPGTEEDETGMVIDRIPDGIVSTSWLLGASLGIDF